LEEASQDSLEDTARLDGEADSAIPIPFADGFPGFQEDGGLILLMGSHIMELAGCTPTTQAAIPFHTHSLTATCHIELAYSFSNRKELMYNANVEFKKMTEFKRKELK
jgi:hypothetical protein